jgi:hypothetical protein
MAAWRPTAARGASLLTFLLWLPPLAQAETAVESPGSPADFLLAEGRVSAPERRPWAWPIVTKLIETSTDPGFSPSRSAGGRRRRGFWSASAASRIGARSLGAQVGRGLTVGARHEALS